jgi:hypothetical protein
MLVGIHAMHAPAGIAVLFIMRVEFGGLMVLGVGLSNAFGEL